VHVAVNEYPEGWEGWLAFLGAQLPGPVRRQEHENGALTFTAGEPPLVVVRLTPAAIRVARVIRVSRRAGSTFVQYRWIGRIAWGHLPGRRSVHLVEQFVTVARELRLAVYRTCFVCNRRLPPEWMEEDTDICRRCGRRG
jgi:hypothetical protein